MSEGKYFDTTPEAIAQRKHWRYLRALHRLGLHETMLMMKRGKDVYDVCEHPYSSNFF